MNNPYSTVHSVIITEKATVMSDELGKYCFKVDRKATKPQIKEAVEDIFDVTVDSVNVMNQHGKRKRLRQTKYGKRPDWKKAIVTLSEGEIELV
ncbi:MAG: 50S ribosomal protein L23 [Verrucomicrobiota bacterium]